MKPSQLKLLGAAAAALSLAAALPHGALAAGAGDKGSDKSSSVGNPLFTDTPGFNDLDTNHDGRLSRAEAAKRPDLADRFNEIDSDHDGKLSRAEYLKMAAKKDFNSVREKAADIIEPGSSSSASGSSKSDSGKK